MEKKNLRMLLLGTSNSLMVNGISAAFAEHFDLNNKSMGASSIGSAIYRICETPKILETDVIVIDYSLNDGEHIRRQWIEPAEMARQVEWMYSTLSKINPNVFCLIMPELYYVDKLVHSFGRNLHIEMAQKYGCEVIDGYAYVTELLESGLGTQEIFHDGAHLHREVAFNFAAKASEKIKSKTEKRAKSRKKFASKFEALTPEMFAQGLELRSLPTSIFSDLCVLLTQGQKIELTKSGKLIGLVVNADGNSKIKISAGDKTIVKNIYSSVFGDGVTQVKFVPLFLPSISDKYEISIADFSDSETEQSPDSFKKLNPENYGKADIFGILFENI